MQNTSESARERHVLILIAMEAEAAPLLAKLAIPEITFGDCFCPCKGYSGVYKGQRISVVTNGKCALSSDGNGVDNVGTTPAAIATYVAITQLKPTLVINAGTAGGFKSKGAVIGDTFVSTILRHHDRRITIPGWDDYARGHHKAHPCDQLIQSLGFKTGVVTTGNSLDATDTCRKEMLTNDASVKDMEGAAIAWVAEYANIPFIAIKCVTDIVDGDQPTHEEFMANLSTAAASLQVSLINTVEYLIGKENSNL
jgi:5'-methylthioadenosine nucleosidase